MDDATLAALRIVASAALDLSFAALVGGLLTPLLMAGAESDWRERQANRSAILLVVAALVALLANGALLWIAAISMTELPPWAALQASGPIVSGTQFGRGWSASTVALVLALLASYRRGLVIIATLFFAVSHAAMGHSGANGVGAPTMVMAAHVLATATWAGLVFAAALVALRDAEAADPAALAGYLRALSAVATGALALVVLSGGAGAWHALRGTLGPLVSTTWGALLDAKLVLVAAAVALGAWNRLVVLPPLRAALVAGKPGGAALQRFTRVIRLEAGVLLAALVLAAVLANGEPPVA